MGIKASEINLRRTAEGFTFASTYDREVGERWAIGVVVRAELHQPRSSKHLRWYRALCRTIWRHQDFLPSAEAVHRALQLRLGAYDRIEMRNGDVIIDFHSVSFSKMDEGEFKNHVDRCWDIISHEIIPGADDSVRQQLIREVDELLLGH
jgi:hypothetical protein